MRNLLPLYAGNDLTSPIRREQVRRHVKVCSACRERLRDHRCSLSRLRSMTSGSAPVDTDAFEQDLEERLSERPSLRERRDEETGHPSSRSWRPVLFKGIRSAALLFVGLAIGFGGMVLVPDGSNRGEAPGATPRTDDARPERLNEPADVMTRFDESTRTPMLRGRQRPAYRAAPMTEIRRSDGERTELFMQPMYRQGAPPEIRLEQTSEKVSAVGM